MRVAEADGNVIHFNLRMELDGKLRNKMSPVKRPTLTGFKLLVSFITADFHCLFLALFCEWKSIQFEKWEKNTKTKPDGKQQQKKKNAG